MQAIASTFCKACMSVHTDQNVDELRKIFQKKKNVIENSNVENVYKTTSDKEKT